MKAVYQTTSMKDLALMCLDLFKKNKKIYLLKGDLGAGKTTFVSSFIKENFKDQYTDFDKIQVMSPTFSIVNQYDLKKNSIAHLDLFRLSEKDFDLEEILEVLESADYCFIEWPSKIKGLEDALKGQCNVLKFSLLSDGRRQVELS